MIHGQRGCPQFNRCPQAELPTGGLEDTEPSAPAADRRRRARFGGWLSGTVSGRPACELSPRDDRRRSIQARRHARSRPTPRPDRAVRAGMMRGCGEHASGTAAHSQGRSRLSREGRGSGRVRESRGARRARVRERVEKWFIFHHWYKKDPKRHARRAHARSLARVMAHATRSNARLASRKCDRPRSRQSTAC